MTLEERVLRNDKSRNYSDSEIRCHIENGIEVYTTYEEYEKACTDLVDPEDVPGIWEQLYTSTVDGITYKYELVP